MIKTPADLAFAAQKAVASADWPAAVEAFRALLKAVPDAPASLHYNLGLALKHAGDLAAALLSLDQALALAPAHQGAMFERGAVLMESGRWTEALGAFTSYRERFPADQDGLRNAARLLTALGRWQEAEQLWRGLPGTDAEALLCRLTCALETGSSEADTLVTKAASLNSARAAFLKHMTHASRGRMPLSAAALQGS
jgi:protein O-GlcNAc transferase